MPQSSKFSARISIAFVETRVVSVRRSFLTFELATMFFTPACPVDLREKIWVERRMQWLVQQFGSQRLLNATIVEPDDRFFPFAYEPTDVGADAVLQQVCEYMMLPRDQYVLKFTSSETQGVDLQDFRQADGSRIQIELDRAILPDLLRVVAVLVSQLAWAEIGGGDNPRVSRDAGDAASVADLFAVYCGMGIFQTRVRLAPTHTDRTWEYATIRRQGVLPARIPAYAMSLIAWAQKDKKPSWLNAMDPEAKLVCKSGLKFLFKTQDSVFAPHEDAPRRLPETGELIQSLRTGTVSERMNAMHEMQALETIPDECAMPLAENLFERDPILVATTTQVLASMGTVAQSMSLDKLIDLFDSPHVEVRSNSLLAASKIQPDPSADTGAGVTIVERIGNALNDSSLSIIQSALFALSSYGESARSVAPRIVPKLVSAARNCEYGNLATLLQGLEQIVPDVGEFLAEHTAHLDPEIREQIEFQHKELQNPENDERTETGEMFDSSLTDGGDMLGF